MTRCSCPPAPRSRGARWSVLVLGLLAVVTLAVGPGPVRATAAVTPADHQFSDPVWLPIRTPASVGCTRTACDHGPAHGFWAIDFTGHRNDPIHPAGAGTAHIGGDSAACSGSSGSDRGRWVWVDHGAGVVTHYRHLNAITVKEGQAVTPATLIGRMGGSGSPPPCAERNYLHFEIRHGGVAGELVEPGQLKACTASGVVSLPAVWGATSWDDPRVHPRPRRMTPAATASCVGSPWLSTPGAPVLKVVRRDRAVEATWSAPAAGVDSVAVQLQIWHPSTREWGPAGYRSLPRTAAATVFTGLTNGRKYRVDATFHSATGNGRSSARLEVVPAAVPAAPGKPRFLTWPKRDYVHYGWPRPEANGSKVTAFTSARRCRTGTKPYGAWRSYTRQADAVYLNFRGLSGFSACEVRVRATNAMGTGAWSETRTVRR